MKNGRSHRIESSTRHVHGFGYQPVVTIMVENDDERIPDNEIRYYFKEFYRSQPEAERRAAEIRPIVANRYISELSAQQQRAATEDESW